MSFKKREFIKKAPGLSGAFFNAFDNNEKE